MLWCDIHAELRFLDGLLISPLLGENVLLNETCTPLSLSSCELVYSYGDHACLEVTEVNGRNVLWGGGGELSLLCALCIEALFSPGNLKTACPL